MIENEQKQAAQVFAITWSANAGQEKSETQAFWSTLLRDVFGVKKPELVIFFEKKASLKHPGFIDALIPSTHVLIEQKSKGIDLSKHYPQSDGTMLTPFEQAKRYVDAQPYSQRARMVIVCNFEEFWLYDLTQANPQPQVIRLLDLPQEFTRFNFLLDPTVLNKEQELIAHKTAISIEAGKCIAQLYTKLLALYVHEDKEFVERSLNKLCMRLVFCWYADDAGLFGEELKFQEHMRYESSSCFRLALYKFFEVLDTPQEKRWKEDGKVVDFPYVDGGLFSDAHRDLVPQLTPEVLEFIINKAGARFNWSQISPTIFGALFESTLNPDLRRTGGMHYTSVENIHKVIDPLFMDDLHEEFAACKKLRKGKKRTQKLQEFQNKLASLTFLDPACGSGNFLSEAYISLRRLENEVIRELFNNQALLGLENLNPVKVSISQFYGIEVNDFAVSVAKTALWIAESQMQAETNSIIKRDIKLFPLESYPNIVEDNALTLPWEQVVPLDKLSFIIGNPPFSGARYMTEANKQDLQQVFGSDWPGKVADLDLVSGWFKKAHDVMCAAPHVKTAFVATNSICQGTAITNLWEPLLKGGSEITFAYRSFLWDNEASNKASVFCVIVGLGNKANPASTVRRIFENDVAQPAKHINAYLLSGPDAFVVAREHPLCDVPEGCMGNQPIDDGNYLFTPEQKAEFLRQEPNAAPYFHRWYGSKELLQGIERYCLYVGDCNESEIAAMPLVQERVEAVKQYRLQSQRQSTINLAERPQCFQTTYIPTSPFLVIPKVSSGAREYIPLGMMQPQDGLCSDLLKLFPQATLFHFSVLSSVLHTVWLQVVGGRLKMDWRYSTELVYNTFPWPQKVDSKLQQKMEKAAQKILDTRSKHQGCSLAQLYDRETMPADLRQAHHANDLLVLQAYGFDDSWSRDELFAALYKLYCKLLAAKK